MAEYSLPLTVESGEERGHIVCGDISENFVVNYVGKGLGFPSPGRGRLLNSSSQSPNESPEDLKETPFDCFSLKKMILNPENKVKIRPVLLALSGLPDSGKTQALLHIMKHHVDVSPYLPISNQKSQTKTAQGIAHQELVGVGVRDLQLVQTTSDFSCAFGIMSAFKEQMIKNKQVPLLATKRHRHHSRKQDISFGKESDLELHLETVFNQISSIEHIPKGLTLDEEEKRFMKHLKELPKGAALFNIWNIDIQKSALYCLFSFFGHLYNSNTWLFLDIERDLDKLDQPPDDPKSSLPKTHGSLAIKWRPRLHYLLRASKLSHGGKSKCDRQKVATIFARYTREGFNGNFHEKFKKLEEKVQQAARQIGVSELIEPNIQSINLANKEVSDDYSQRLYQKLHQIFCETPYEEVPLSWIFLRSLFYSKQKFISKQSLQIKANECGITNENFDKFCRFFASFGSIIDFTLIDPNNSIIVLAPIEFLQYIDKILHPEEELYSQYPMLQEGLITDTVCKKIYEADTGRSTYTDALLSIGLAAKVTGCVEEILSSLPKAQHYDTLFYVPQMRKKKIISKSVVDPTAVYLITSPDSPHIYKQARLVKSLLSSRQSAKLRPCPEENQTIIYDTATDLLITFVSFSPSTKVDIKQVSTNEVPTVINSEVLNVYASVVKAFHEVALPHEIGIVKYQFTVMCAQDKIETRPPFCHQHVLPDQVLCNACQKANKITDHLRAWNKVLTEDPIPRESLIKDSKLDLSQLSFIAQEFKLHPEFIPELMQVLEYTEDHIKLKGLEGGKLVMEMLLDWDKGLDPIGGGNQKKDVARSLLHLAIKTKPLEPLTTLKDQKRFDFFLKIAKEFDIYGTDV